MHQVDHKKSSFIIHNNCSTMTRQQESQYTSSAWLPIQAVTHLGDVGYSLHLHLSGAGDFRRGGVQDLHPQADEQTGPEGHSFSEPFVQLLVLVHQGVSTSGAVHVNPGRSQRGKEAWQINKYSI